MRRWTKVEFWVGILLLLSANRSFATLHPTLSNRILTTPQVELYLAQIYGDRPRGNMTKVDLRADNGVQSYFVEFGEGDQIWGSIYNNERHEYNIFFKDGRSKSGVIVHGQQEYVIKYHGRLMEKGRVRRDNSLSYEIFNHQKNDLVSPGGPSFPHDLTESFDVEILESGDERNEPDFIEKIKPKGESD